MCCEAGAILQLFDETVLEVIREITNCEDKCLSFAERALDELGRVSGITREGQKQRVSTASTRALQPNAQCIISMTVCQPRLRHNHLVVLGSKRARRASSCESEGAPQLVPPSTTASYHAHAVGFVLTVGGLRSHVQPGERCKIFLKQRVQESNAPKRAARMSRF
jgi:hypothetical protein